MPVPGGAASAGKAALPRAAAVAPNQPGLSTGGDAARAGSMAAPANNAIRLTFIRCVDRAATARSTAACGDTARQAEAGEDFQPERRLGKTHP